MRPKNITRLELAAGAAALAGTRAVAADKPEVDIEAVKKAFETLKTYDWGTDRKTLNPIDDAVVATQGSANGRKRLQRGLLTVLKSDASRSAKDYVLRTLKTMGTAESVPALADLLPEKGLSHMARYALERIPAPEAAAAMRDALPKLTGELKVGVIGSLGVRRDAACVPALAALLGDANQAVAGAAANSLGAIGTPPSGKALGAAAKQAAQGMKPAIADASLACAEHLLADGKKTPAIVLYKSLSGEGQPKHVRLAATRGLLAAAGK